jgi:integrase
MFDRHVTAAGLPRIRLHDLRHSWASLALGAGVHPKIVSERLGHASISVMLDTYSHVTVGLQQDAADTVAALLR